MKRPGDIVQTANALNSTADTPTSATFVALGHNAATITPSSAANLIRVEALGALLFITGGTADIQLSRGNVNNTNLIGNRQRGVTVAGTGNPTYPTSLLAFDTPNTSSAQVYVVQGRSSSGSIGYPAAGATLMAATEIQI